MKSATCSRSPSIIITEDSGIDMSMDDSKDVILRHRQIVKVH